MQFRAFEKEIVIVERSAIDYRPILEMASLKSENVKYKLMTLISMYVLCLQLTAIPWVWFSKKLVLDTLHSMCLLPYVTCHVCELLF